MNDYRLIVDVIKDVTQIDVPVYFDCMEANCSGSPYFGLGKHGWDVVDDDFMSNPMFELEDFIENHHLPLFHIGLPNRILKEKDGYVYKVTEEQLKEHGIHIKLDESLLEIFIILHEFGHAKQLYVDYEGNVEKYLQETRQESRSASFQIRHDGLGGTEEGLRIHKSTSTEQFADSFAIEYFEQVTDIISRIKISA